MFFHCSVLRFWIIVLKLHVLKIVLVSIMSIILILLALCGRHSFIFFSAHSVFITAERSVMKRHM